MDASDLFKKLSAGAHFRRTSQVKFNNSISSVKIEDAAGSNLSSTEKEIEQIFLEDSPKSKRRKKTIEDDSVKLFDDYEFTSATLSDKKAKKKRSASELEKERIAQIRNRHHISVIGKNVPAPIEVFQQFQISEVLLKNVAAAGFAAPTPIQVQAIPLLLEGREVLACAPTGSGKTLAFLLPILHHLRGPRAGGFRACVVCPTRELASQTFRECTRLGEGTNLRTVLISKMSHIKEKVTVKLATKYDILITTPNRLVHLLKQDPPVISLEKVEWLIVDECDKLFEAGVRGFRDQLAHIYTSCAASTVKRAMFSATQSPPLTKWCRRNLKGLVTINIGVRNTACSDVDQELVFVGSEAGKLVAMRNIIKKGFSPPVLVFVQSKERAQELFNELIYDGVNVDVIHSDRTQAQRDNVIRCFREGKIWVLICTELMGRGIDFKGVNLVINYDFPPSPVAYIHRVGRTGRAGRRGKAVTFFTLDDTTNLRSIARIVKESGSAVSDYMLSLSKPTKREKKELERRAPERETISTTPIYEQVLQKRKDNAIKRSKRKLKKT